MSDATSSKPGNHGFDGDDFSNNLISDLAPLLTLFGEQVTKQFLSMSMGWADDILLALGPLGIMTIVVSAIRVGGVRRLKTIVGRARESRATAEAELLSSTSDQVCELWNGQEIVRTFGESNTKELIIAERCRIEKNVTLTAFDLGEAYNASHMIDANGKKVSKEDIDGISRGAPNISLNIPGSTISSWEIWTLVAVGIIAQLSALVIPGVLIYCGKWNVASYGYPCYILGSTALIAGLILCSRTIEGSTTEYDFVPRFQHPDRHSSIHVVRIQMGCELNDQSYQPYILDCAPRGSRIRTSRPNTKDYRAISAFSALLSLAGFVSQFVGLRALHWSTTVMSLAVTLLMTCIRAWVRRGLGAYPRCLPLPLDHEIPWAVLAIVHSYHSSCGQWRLNWPESQNNKQDWRNIRCRHDPPPPSFTPHFEGVAGAYRQLTPNLNYNPICYFPVSALHSTDKAEHTHVIYSLVDLLGSMQYRFRTPGLERDREAVEELSNALCYSMSAIGNSPSIRWLHRTNGELNQPARIDQFSWDIDVTCLRPRQQDSQRSPGWTEQYSRGVYRISMEKLRRGWDGPSAWVLINKLEDIQALLSLWACSVDSRDVLTNRTPVIRKPHLRIIGHSQPAQLPGTLSNLSKWLEADLIVCPRPDGTAVCDFVTIKGIRVDEADVKCFPVFGAHYSTLYKYDRVVYRDPHITATENARPQLSFESTEDPASITHFAVRSDRRSVKVQCALEIFSIFMAALVPLIYDLGGNVNRMWKETGVEDPYVYKNSVVEDLVDGLMRCAPILFPHRLSAEELLIPAFFQAGLLRVPQSMDDDQATTGANEQASRSQRDGTD